MAYKILIVDDIDENRLLLSTILKKNNPEYTIIDAVNGEEAIKIAKQEAPDIILMDWKMPIMDGIEATKKIKENKNTRSIPIIIITAFSQEVNLEDAFITGANDFLGKPINPSELLARVKAFLEYHDMLLKVQNQKDIIEDKNKKLNRLSLVVKKNENSIIIINPELEINWINEGFSNIHGYSLKDYKNKYGKKINNINYYKDIESIIQKSIKNKKSAKFIRKCVSKSGKTTWLKVSLTPIFNNKDEIEELFFAETEISKLKDTEEALNTSNEQLQAIKEYLENTNKQLRTQKNDLLEKQKDLEIEQEKSERLLNSLFPKEVAWQLKSKGKVKPRHYRKVTVFFSDFKGFSRSCENLDPKEIVNILDSYFVKFDEITEKHFIEKIKTIGDAYMCVGGLPLRNHSHPFNVVLAGLQIQDYMNKLNDKKVLENLPVWELRVGIHTGDVIAGVVGKNKYAYDIWGGNVNIASRMEQNGAVGLVNISGSTYEEIKDYFDCIYRGKIEAKNIGKIDMYFVEGLKKEYAKDNTRCYPNEKFISFLNSI